MNNKINYVFLDTETTGLHIINDKPFTICYAGLSTTPVNLPATPTNVKRITHILSQPNTWLIGHNIKFDCHMLLNVGVPMSVFKNVNLIDTMFMARLAVDHDDQVSDERRNKPPIKLALTDLSMRYLNSDSKDEEKQTREVYKQLKDTHKVKFNIELTGWLGKKPTTQELNMYYNLKETEILKDEFPFQDSVLQLREEWFKNNPVPTYKDIPSYIMEPYVTKDVVLTRALFITFLDVIRLKGQLDILARESRAMYPLLLMEREGMVIDKAEASNKYKELYQLRKTLNVIISPITLIKENAKVYNSSVHTFVPSRKTRVVVYDDENNVYNEYAKADVILTKGEEVNTKSTQQMAAVYSYETGTEIKTANKKTREEIEHLSPSAKKLNLLRPLDKMIDTYLTRLINETVLDDNGEWKLYGTYNNLDNSYGKDQDTAGTVTGRLSSDLQQFPKEPILTEAGEELVNIRRLFIKPKNAHAMMYFDMGQLELRLQTIWSDIIDGHPDKTMARGFVPYDCTELFDDDGTSLGWFLNEDLSIPWHPTDFHTATAKVAFGNVPDYEENKKHYRSLGKRANFAIGYGASKWKLVDSLGVSERTAQDLINGWKQAYVGLTSMESYLYNITKVKEYQTNLFGRRYYTRNVHKLKNWLVQGSGGDLLKIYLARLIPFVEKYPHWKLMLTVHDEIDFVLMKEPTKEEVQEVLDLMYYKMGDIELTADAEITYVSWADAVEYEM